MHVFLFQNRGVLDGVNGLGGGPTVSQVPQWKQNVYSGSHLLNEFGVM